MLRTMTTTRSVATWLAFSLALLGCSIAQDPASEVSSPEILWDTWGVPHIYASDAVDLFYGFGWAVLGGFLLTASKNWVGIRGYHGGVLMALVAAWLLERIAMSFGAFAPIEKF